MALGLPTIGLFSPDDEECWIPQKRKRVQVIRLDKAGKVDLETLMEAVEMVTEGRTTKAARVIDPSIAATMPDDNKPASSPSNE